MGAIAVQREQQKLVLTSSSLPDVVADSEHWEARQLSNHRFIVQRQSLMDTDPHDLYGFGVASVHLLFNLIISLHEGEWNGVLNIGCDQGPKQIFFRSGEVISARSAQIDDRLGEILYRRGVITLDELSDISSRVNRERKFGQLLLEIERFSPCDLWEALRCQSEEIIRSIFFERDLNFELISGEQFPHVEIRLTEPLLRFIRSAYCYGVAVEEFRSRITAESEINLVAPGNKEALNHLPEFKRDLVSLSVDNPTVGAFVQACKLPEVYTLAALMDMMDCGICTVDQTKPPSKLGTKQTLSLLRSRIDTYSILLEKAKILCQTDGCSIPVEHLKDFCVRQEKQNTKQISLTSDGEVSSSAIRRMFSQAAALPEVRKFYEANLEALTCFLVQSLADILPQQASEEIRQLYQTLS